MTGPTDTQIERARLAVARELTARTRHAVRDLCERSLLAFCATWMPKRFSLEFGEVHERSARVIQDLMRPAPPSPTLAIAMPPRHGKTSLVAFGLPLWAVCARGEQRVCVVTRTADAARELFHDLAAALRPGEPLALAYPHAAGPRLKQNVGAAEGPQPTCHRTRHERQDPEGSKGRFAGDLSLRCGACLSVVSRFRSVTGASREVRLPSLLVLDDLETWSAPGVWGQWSQEYFEQDEDERHEALQAWIDFTLERRLLDGGRCVAVGSIPGPDSWLAARCDLLNRDGWSKMTTPANLAFPPEMESKRVFTLMRSGRKHERALEALLAQCRRRDAWPAGATNADITALRRRARSAIAYGSPYGTEWFSALWYGEVMRGTWGGWCKVRDVAPATNRFLMGGICMLEEDAKTGVRAFLAMDSKFAARKWFPDSDPPPDASAQAEAKVPMYVCVQERSQPGAAPALMMCSHHAHCPVTDPDRPAYWRVAGEAIRLGRDRHTDLRKPEERDRLAERSRKERE